VNRIHYKILDTPMFAGNASRESGTQSSQQWAYL